MIQKKRDIATMCKNSQYTGLYNPTNITYKDFVKLQFEIQGMYDDIDILEDEVNSSTAAVDLEEGAEQQDDDTTSKDLKTLQCTVDHFQQQEQLVTDFVSRFENHITNLSEAIEKDDQIELAPPEDKGTRVQVKRDDALQKIVNLKLRIQEIRIKRMEEEEAEQNLREKLKERKSRLRQLRRDLKIEEQS